MIVLVLIQDCITSVHVKWQNPDFLKNVSHSGLQTQTKIFLCISTHLLAVVWVQLERHYHFFFLFWVTKIQLYL